MNAPIRTIHVGSRGRGEWPVRLLSADERFEPVAIVSREPDAVGDELGLASLDPDRAYRSLDATLEAVDADAVVVCTPVDLHERDLRTAYAAHKHVLVEKCLARRWDEACALVDEADAAGVQLVVAQNSRYRPETRTLHAAVTSGAYGSPTLVDLAMQKYRPAPRQQDYPFAMFWDQGCHHVDDLQWCFGPVAEVTARTFSAPWSRYADDAAIQVLLRFATGVTATYLLSNVARWNELRWSVQSEQGVLSLRGDQWVWVAAAAPDDASFGWNEPPVEVPPLAPRSRSGEYGVVDAFYRAVTTGAAVEISGRPNLETLRVCEMVERSGIAGRPVTHAEVSS